MKYIFRDNIVFEYRPEIKDVIQHKVSGVIAAYDFCGFIPEDYKLLSEFFDKAYRHIQGEKVELKDIVVM